MGCCSEYEEDIMKCSCLSCRAIQRRVAEQEEVKRLLPNIKREPYKTEYPCRYTGDKND